MTAAAPHLSEAHRKALSEESGLGEGIVRERGYFTAETPDQVPDVFKNSYQRIAPSLVIPVWGVDGEIVTYQLRPDKPRTFDGKTIKYEFPRGGRMVLDVGPVNAKRLADPKVPLWITEGIKKADAATFRGLCCIALLGVTCWKGKSAEGGKGVALADWHNIALSGREIYIAFDSDVMVNPHVMIQLKEFARWLKSKQANVKFVILPSAPGEKVGLDDYFQKGGTPTDLVKLARTYLPGSSASEVSEEFPLTDLGNAERMAAMFRDEIRWCNSTSKWLVWDERRWEEDPHGDALANQAATTVAREMKRIAQDMEAAADSPEEKKKNAMVKWAVSSESLARRNAMVSIFKTLPGMAASVDELDQFPNLVNFRNGTYDLDTGTLLPHSRDHYITKLIDINYDPNAKCPQWINFLEKIMGGSTDLILYLMKACGYSLSGYTSEQKFFFLFGGGANGKSTFVQVLLEILGRDYSKSTSSQTLMAQGNQKNSANELARFRGVRFMAASETGEGKYLDEQLVKDVTGQEQITGCFKFQEPFDYQPQFKIWMAGNHKPGIKSNDPAIWRRVVEIPFTVFIPEDERDPNLREKLLSEEQGILAWMVAGHKQWRLHGLKAPAEIASAIEEYRSEMDLIGAFLEEKTEFVPDFQIGASELFSVWVKWCEASGERPGKQRAFGNKMTYRGEKSFKGSDGKKYYRNRQLANQGEGSEWFHRD